jgi:hypothetical protein
MPFPLALWLTAVTLQGPPVNAARPFSVVITYRVEAPRKVNAKSPKKLRIGARELRLAPGGAPAEAQVRPGDAVHGQVAVETEYFVCEDRVDAPCLRRSVRFALPVDPARAPDAIIRLETPVFTEK